MTFTESVLDIWKGCFTIVGMRKTSDTATSVAKEPKLSETDKRQRNQYLKEFGPAIASYVVVLIVVLSLVEQDTPGAKFWLLLPVVPVLGVALAIYRSLQRADEYIRLIQLEAMALGFGAAVLASVILGFLGVAGVALSYGGWLVFAAAMSTWGLALGLRGLRP